MPVAPFRRLLDLSAIDKNGYENKKIRIGVSDSITKAIGYIPTYGVFLRNLAEVDVTSGGKLPGFDFDRAERYFNHRPVDILLESRASALDLENKVFGPK